MNCTCGHTDEEHDIVKFSQPCEVEGCDCPGYDWDGE